ncbi:MAG: hypothetical protein J0L86_03325 [Flavobacteriales bacterium]|nr:hypothetical protein [Flavobacteriales bacterium]
MKEEEINWKNNNLMIEAVAEKIHNHWMIWAKELLESEPKISNERKTRWQKECFMSYENLSEEMKDLDRKFAIEIIKTLKNKL